MLCFPWGAFSQSVPPDRSFEVASVKIQRDPHGLFIVSSSGPRFRCEACTIRDLIMYSYDLKNYQVAIPYSEEKYDIVAKAEGDSVPTKAAFRQMMRSLLGERFKLKVHREMKEMPVWAMVIAKQGLKLKESAPDAEHRWRVGVNGRTYQITMNKVTADEIASGISGVDDWDRPIVNQTGLTGTYDAILSYTPRWASRQDEADPQGLIFYALQKQLGLSLGRQNAMVEILVVDHVEQPSEN